MLVGEAQRLLTDRTRLRGNIGTRAYAQDVLAC